MRTGGVKISFSAKYKLIAGLDTLRRFAAATCIVIIIMCFFAGCETTYTSSVHVPESALEEAEVPEVLSKESSSLVEDTEDFSTEQIYVPTAGEIQTLSETIKQSVKNLTYTNKVVEDFNDMVLGWRNKQGHSVLAVWRMQLSESRNEYAQGKIDTSILARNEIIKAQQLNQKIRYEIEYEEKISDLDEVILHKQANCLGFTQTFYILANSIGLKTNAINILETAARDSTSEEDKDKGHIADLVYLSDDKVIMVDLAQRPYPMASRPFQLSQEFTQDGRNYSIRRRRNSLGIHTKFQILDCNELVGTLHYTRLWSAAH